VLIVQFEITTLEVVLEFRPPARFHLDRGGAPPETPRETRKTPLVPSLFVLHSPELSLKARSVHLASFAIARTILARDAARELSNAPPPVCSSQSNTR